MHIVTLFFATFVGWLICLLIGLFSKLGNGISESLVMESNVDGAIFNSGEDVFIALIGFVGASWLIIWLLLFLAAARSGIYDENRYLFFLNRNTYLENTIEQINHRLNRNSYSNGGGYCDYN